MNRGNFSIDPDEEMKRNCCGTLGRGFNDFSRADLRDIILDKNKVIADLEEHAYGSASWIENLNKGLKKANERKRNAPPKESDEEFRKRLEDFDKGSAPTEAWGADELDGDGFFGDIFKQADKEGKEKWDKLSPEEKLRAEIRQNVRVHKGQADFFNKRHYEKLAKLEADYESNLARRIADAKETGRPVNESAISALRASRKRATEDFTKEMAALGGGVVVSKEPSREPPREPPKDPPLVMADGSNAAEITAGALTPEQKIIIQTALEYANEQALATTGWQDRMYPAELNRWVAAFRQNVSPALLPVVDENIALIRQLANMRPDLRANYIESIVDDIGRSLNRAISSSGKKPDAVYKQIEKRKGGAAVPTPTEPKISPVAATAAALAPVRTAIQNGIGDAIYGKSDDPKKQKKGLLGISEEGKEESQKKVMKNIVVPVVKWAKQAGQDIEDTANKIFNPDKYDADMKERRIKQIKRTEAEAGIVRDKANPSIIIRKPAGLWKADTSDPNEVAYNTQRIASRKPEDVFYVRVPNPIFAAKLRPSFQELGKAGFVKQVGREKQLDLWTGVQQLDPKSKEDIDGTLQRLHDDEFIWLPEDRAKEIYGKLREIVVGKEDEQIVEGYDEDGQRWTKGNLKRFAAIDPRTLKGKELLDWKRGKLQIDTAGTRIALAKVNKDIANAEERGEQYMVINNLPVKRKDAVAYQASDRAEMAKLRAEKERLEKRTTDIQKGKERFVAEDNAFNIAAAAKREKDYRDFWERNARENQEQQEKDTAEWEAKPVAEKIAILEKALADPQNNQMEIDLYTEQIEQLRTEEASEKVEEQAQGSVDLLQQAEVIGAEGGGMWEDEAEMEGAGAMEYILQKAGMPIFNPSGDTTKAGRQSFTPDYDAYGDDEEEGRLNAFNLSASMYNQSKAIELPDFKLLKDDTSLRFYRKDDEDVILVGVRGTDFQSWTDFYTWFVIGGRGDLRLTTRFMDDLAKLVAFQRNYPPSQFYYVATGHSLAGSIIDRFLEMGLIEEAITYNPSIEKKHMLDENILNHRVYLDTDPLFILMGQYSPNTEIRVNPNKTNFYNPSKEKDYLIKSHLIYPVSNPALEGGGMEGSGKTYTLEEWKAIFDAKLEQKRQQIEAREAKKKQTAKAKRERAKAVRDGRDEPPPLETPAVFRTSRVQKATPPKEREPEAEDDGRKSLDGKILSSLQDWKNLGATIYKFGDTTYYVEDPRDAEDMNLDFYKSRQVCSRTIKGANTKLVLIGRLGEEKEPFQGLMKKVIKAEFPSVKDYRETMGLEAPKKPRFKIVAPASARVELREELVAEQPRSPAGEFAKPAETAVVAVSQAPQQAYMKLMKSPKLTDAEKGMLRNLRARPITPKMRAVLLGRSGLARKVMEILGIDESAFQTPKGQLRIADKVDKRVEGTKVRDVEVEKKLWGDVNKVINDAFDEGVEDGDDELNSMFRICISVLKTIKRAIEVDCFGNWTVNVKAIRQFNPDRVLGYNVQTDLVQNKTPKLTIGDTTETERDRRNRDALFRGYNFSLTDQRNLQMSGIENPAQLNLYDTKLLENFRRDFIRRGEIMKMKVLMIIQQFFPLMGLPELKIVRGSGNARKWEMDWKELPLVKSAKGKAKEELPAKLREYAVPKLEKFIEETRKKLSEIIKRVRRDYELNVGDE